MLNNTIAIGDVSMGYKYPELERMLSPDTDKITRRTAFDVLLERVKKMRP